MRHKIQSPEIPVKHLRFFGLGKILPFMKKYPRLIIRMLFTGAVSSVIDTAVPLFQRYALNTFVANKTLSHLASFIIIYVALILFQAVMNYISARDTFVLEVSMNRDLRQAAYHHLQTLSFSYFDSNSVGYVHARVMSDTSRIGELVSWSIMQVVWYIPYLILSIIIMLIINTHLALMVLIIVPLITVVFSLFQSSLVRVNRQVREINSKITGSFNEGITGAKTIKSLVAEEKTEKKFFSLTSDMKKKSVKAARLRGVFGATMDFATSIALAVVLWKGGYIAENEIGTFSMFVSYAQGMMEPIRWIIETISDFITTRVNIERLVNLLETKSNVSDREEVIEKYGDTFSPKKENWEEINGDIEFDNVTFGYPGYEGNVLENFSLKIPSGSSVAIVGETGAGKSTLVNLICRFYEPTSGRILIDGKDVSDRSQLWLHSSLGYVLQTPYLFSGTVRENLLYGRPDASDEEIVNALRLVSAEYLLDKLENGLDTDVGEGGDTLSTGEKQLLSFARAVLAEPRIMILDEATASVDTITEMKIQSAIETVIKGRTSVMIAHRLSTVRNADMILVVRNGKIIERGTHGELIQSRGEYYKMYMRQFEDEKSEAVLASK